MDLLPPDKKSLLAFIDRILRVSGSLAKEKFGLLHTVSTKEDPNQIVTEVDLASEKLLLQAIEQAFPTDSIIAEESGFRRKESNFTWIIDPIDGSSNYANHMPWYGVMVARLHNWIPDAAGIYLPATDEMFLTVQAGGTYYNGHKIQVIPQVSLKESLISFCVDSSDDPSEIRFISQLYGNIVKAARNTRCTNCAVDYAYAAVGKLGATINLNNKIWDVAPGLLLAKEAGNIVTDSEGNPLQLSVTEGNFMKNFTLIISHPAIHDEVLSLIKKSR